MNTFIRHSLVSLALLFPLPLLAQDDPYRWLEDVDGERALSWVEAQNKATKGALTTHATFQQIYDHTLTILNAEDRLQIATRHGDVVYDFWRDAQNPRGVYRRATLESYLADDPKWEVLLDVDALAASEKQNWVFKGMELRWPDYTRGLLRLSIGGADAVVIREFDLVTRTFVPDGFALPEAKGSVNWIDEDSVYVATDFGDGSQTDSGYPRIVKVWQRGTPLSAAKAVFEGKNKSVSVRASRDHVDDQVIDWLYESTSFYTSDKYLREGDEKLRLNLPDSSRIHTYYNGLLFIEIKQPARIAEVDYSPGTILTIPLVDLKAGKHNFSVFAPDAVVGATIRSIDRTRSYLIIETMRDVRDEVIRCHFDGGAWVTKKIALAGDGRMTVSSLDADVDHFLLTYTSFLQPTTLYSVDASTLELAKVKQAPARFDAAPYASAQHFATSKDGTKVPYFIVAPKTLELDGRNKTIISAYGGFRIAQRPSYMAALGGNWLDRGGVYVLANIRGGGEYGPEWHQAALRENRHKCFEDLEAVAEDLIARKIATPDTLAIRGGSNGGLLVGAAFTRRPELYKAVVCAVPLLDMKRYSKLLAGASWMAEYGNPDVPEDWAFLRTYSPYHNVVKEKKYPRVLFTTSTRDDRVHPGHARKMVARMIELGHPIYYYENTEGGHAGAANAEQSAYSTALTYCYLLSELGGR